MRNKKGMIITILLSIMAIAAIACEPVPATSPPQEPPIVDSQPAPAPAEPQEPQEPGDIAMEETLAPIESVELSIAESFPPQYFLKVTSGLPNGCVQFDDYQVTRDGNNINITVTNLEPASGQPIACTMNYGLHESNVALGSDFVGGETYTVLVNEQVTETFVAQGTGLPDDNDSGLGMIQKPAPIESIRIELDPQIEGAEIVVMSGLPNACHEFDSYEITRADDNTFLLDIWNTLPADQNIACAEIYGTVETVIPLDDSLEACKVYDIMANGDLHSIQAIAPNVRCANPEPTEPAFPTVEVPAPIENVQIAMTKSLPPQYIVMITSGLPSGCASFHGYDVSRDGDTINITMTNQVPAPEAEIMCTLIYGYEETSINLGSDFEADVTYTVVVNGEVRDTFVGYGDGGASGSGAKLNTEFQLEFLDVAALESDLLEIEFLEVVEDSRCPTSVTCIWAGQAKILLGVITADGEDLGEHELLLQPGAMEQPTVNVSEYEIRLVALNPYPGTPGAIDEADYTATLVVSQSDVKLNLSAQPAAGEAMTYDFVVDLSGGPDNNQELYCTSTGWDFGDDTAFISMPSCIQWTPDITIQRNFEQTHTYEAPGAYEVTFTRRHLSQTIVVDVP